MLFRKPGARWLATLAVLVSVSIILSLVPALGRDAATSELDWTRLANNGLGDPVDMWIVPWLEFNGRLFFIAPPFSTNGGPLWTYDGVKFEKAAPDGFGDPQNGSMFPTAVFQGYLYCGTNNDDGANGSNGGELWRSQDGYSWKQVGKGGFGNIKNEECVPLGVQNGELLVAFVNEDTGVQVYGTPDGTSWTRANQDGFGDQLNRDTSLGVVFNGKIHIMVNKHTGFDESDSTPYVYQGNGSWQKLGPAGFGDPNNDDSHILSTDGRNLYVGIINNVTGGEVWSYDGSSWSQVGEDGMGNKENVWVSPFPWAGSLYVGTGSHDPPFPVGKIYRQRYDGSFEIVVSDGFGDSSNVIISPFYVFHGNLIAGTLNPNGFQVWSAPAPPADTYYFAEGTTRNNAADGTYQEWISVENPNNIDTTVNVTYMLESGDNITRPYVITAHSRLTVNVAGDVGLDRDVSVVVQGEDPIVAERPMYFNYQNKWTGGHVVMGVPSPRDTFYFAEGTTRANPVDGYFEEWLCIQNPNDTEAEVTVTYMLGTGNNVVRTYPVEGEKRRTVNVNAEIGLGQDVSMLVESDVPIVAERPMYFDYHGTWAGGHDVVGAPEPATTLYFAEGTTRSWAQEWICIQNPNQQDANVMLTYQVSGQEQELQAVTVGAASRYTVDVAGAVGTGKDVSVVLESDQPIVAERPMYFNYQDKWPGGHNVMGSASAYYRYYFAEGTTRWNPVDGYFDEWLCLQNPGTAQASVDITFMKTDGTVEEYRIGLETGERQTLSVNTFLGPGVDSAIQVESDLPIVVERPMYFDYHGFATGGHNTLGYGI